MRALLQGFFFSVHQPTTLIATSSMSIFPRYFSATLAKKDSVGA